MRKHNSESDINSRNSNGYTQKGSHRQIPVTSTPTYQRRKANSSGQQRSNVNRNGKPLSKNTNDNNPSVKKERKTLSPVALTILIILLIVSMGLFFVSYWYNTPRVFTDIYREAGSSLTISDFSMSQNDSSYGRFETDVSLINTSVPGDYPVTIIYCDYVTYNSVLHIEDTVAPTAVPVTNEIKLRVTLGPEAFVTDVYDIEPVEISFYNEPDFEFVGTQDINILLTDAASNSIVILSSLTIITDTEAPVLCNVHDLDFYIGDPIMYLTDVYATDNWDTDVEITVDNSAADINNEGEYEIIYTAEDDYGNTTTQTCILTMSVKPEGFEQMDEMNELASEVIESIITDDMTDMEKAFKIYGWVRGNINYAGNSDKTSYIREAIHGFTTHMGDCYTFFAVSKALLDCAGIENIDMVKSDTSYSSHFWNLINVGGGWYHFDTTDFEGTPNHRFMLTDEELRASTHWNSHTFDESLYPERETASVQYMLNYNDFTVDYDAVNPEG